MKCLGKWVEQENIILSEVTQTKEHTWYVITDKWILAPKLTMLMIQPTDHMELRRKKGWIVDVSFLL